MKYVVKLTYTNPAHEHVTLRRRVDTVNRIVEAASEQEALNRAANQQRALGFKIQEAAIVEKEKAPVKTEQLTEASKEGSAVMRGMRATLKSMDLRHGVDSDKREAGYKMSPAVKAAQAKSDVLSKVVKRPQAGTLAAAKLRKEEVEYIEEKLTAADPASKWISDFVASDNPKFAGKSKKERINMALGAYYSAKRGKVEEGYDPSPAEIAKMLVKKHGAGNVTKQHILDLESDRDSYKGLDHDEVVKHVQKMSEEVELDEANMRFDYEAAARPKSSDVKNFLNRDKNPRAAAASKKYIRRMTKLGGLGPNQTKKDTEAHMKAHFEEVELDEAQKKLKPSYWKAEWRLGTQSEVDKNNKKIFDKLAKTDPVKAAAFHDNLMRMKKKDVKEEVVAEANTRVVNKEVKKEKAAETAVAAARRAKNSKNKVETEPRLDMDVGSSEKKYVTKV